MNQTELLMQRRQTTAFINADVLEVSLQRFAPVTTAAGGTKRGAPATVPLQRFRLVPASMRTPTPTAATEGGQVPIFPYVLVGRWDADVQENDEFQLDGRWYQVRKVDPDRLVETRAGVDLRSG